MHITSPEQLAKAFETLFNNQDLQALTGLFASEAAFVPQPGTVVYGENISGALAGFLALNAPIHLTVRRTIVAGDTALIIADWQLAGVDATGAPVNLSGSTADVCRRASDGTWHYLIDNPFGTV